MSCVPTSTAFRSGWISHSPGVFASHEHMEADFIRESEARQPLTRVLEGLFYERPHGKAVDKPPRPVIALFQDTVPEPSQHDRPGLSKARGNLDEHRLARAAVAQPLIAATRTALAACELCLVLVRPKPRCPCEQVVEPVRLNDQTRLLAGHFRPHCVPFHLAGESLPTRIPRNIASLGTPTQRCVATLERTRSLPAPRPRAPCRRRMLSLPGSRSSGHPRSEPRRGRRKTGRPGVSRVGSCFGRAEAGRSPANPDAWRMMRRLIGRGGGWRQGPRCGRRAPAGPAPGRDGRSRPPRSRRRGCGPCAFARSEGGSNDRPDRVRAPPPPPPLRPGPRNRGSRG